MTWCHYETRYEGTIPLRNDKAASAIAAYRYGITSTGRSRVFSGYFVQAVLLSGSEFTGEDKHSLCSALLQLASSLLAADLIITCSGLHPLWRESGLSRNTGWGYFGSRPEAVHMMSPVPPVVETWENGRERPTSEPVAGSWSGTER
jgi:hypothetical protein